MSPVADPARASGPAFSIIVTVHGRSRFLRSALRSLERQTVPRERWEALIAGTFDEPTLASELQASGVEWIPLEAPGLGAKVACAVRTARAPILLFLEDDDEFFPGKLEAVAARFQADPELGYYHHSFVPIDEEGREIPSGFFREGARARIDRRGAVRLAGTVPRKSLGSLTHLFPGYNTSSIAMRREILEPHLDLLSRVELVADQFLLTAALGSRYSMRIDSARLTAIRHHASSASNPQTPRGSERLRRLGEFSARNRESRAILVELARRFRDPAVARAALGAAAVEESIRLLRDPASCRTEMARGLLDLGRCWTSFEVRTFPGVVPLAAVYLGSPSVARALYRWGRGLAS